jgi:ribose transport system substrate-binding protein
MNPGSLENIMLANYKKLLKLIFAFATVACLSAVVHAQALDTGMDDPARAGYYNAFKGKRVVFVPLFMGLDLTEGWAAVLARDAAANGYKFEVRNSNWNTAAGARTITSLISEKPDVILVQNPDVQSYAKLLQQAEKAGIHVIQVNMKTNIVTDGYIGGDWVQAGEIMGKYIGDKCSAPNSTGKVAILVGPPTAAPSVYTLRGAQNTLAKYPKIKVVAVQNGEWDPSKSKNVTQVLLQQHPDLCGIVGAWDVADSGTAAAIKEAGKTGKVLLATTGGGARSACQAVQEGKYDLNVSSDVPGQGRDLANLVKTFLTSGVKPGVVRISQYSPFVLLTKDHASPEKNCWSLEDLK